MHSTQLVCNLCWPHWQQWHYCPAGQWHCCAAGQCCQSKFSLTFVHDLASSSWMSDGRSYNYDVVMWTEIPPFGLLWWIHCLVSCTAILPALDSHPVDCTVLCKCVGTVTISNTQQCHLQCQLSVMNGFQLYTPHKQNFQCYSFTLVNFSSNQT